MTRSDTLLALARNVLIPVRTVADLAARVDELETGIPEQARQAPALDRFVDRLERDVMRVVAARLGEDDPRG